MEGGRAAGEDEPPTPQLLFQRALGEDFHSLLPSISMKLQFFCRKKNMKKQSFGTFLRQKSPFSWKTGQSLAHIHLEMGLVLLEKQPNFSMENWKIGSGWL